MLQRLLILAMALGLWGTAADADASIDADGTVTIHPGETITVGFAGADDPSHPKMATDANAPGTMTFTFAEHEGIGLVLDIQSHLNVTVKYNAVMAVRGHSAHTSSCPVLANIEGTENWRDPITELKLSGFRKVDVDAGVVCD